MRITGLRGGILLLALLAPAPAAFARSGGPDGYGYTWRDSLEPGIVYAWEDVSATGADLVVADDDDANYGFQPLSFAFPYYGAAYTQVAPAINGWASLVDDLSESYLNGALPDPAAPQGILAAFWDDLEVIQFTSHVYFQDDGARAVLTWENVHQYNVPANLYSFQMILYPDGRIAFQYRSMGGPTDSCTIGIESADEVDGLAAVMNDPGGIPASGYRIEFAPPVPLPLHLDCSGAPTLACGASKSGDTSLGIANQDAYRCTAADYSGRELVYRLDFAVPTAVRLQLEVASGDPDIVLVSACDPNLCLAPPGDRVDLSGLAGTFFAVIDSAPGSEGAFTLRMACDPSAPLLDCGGAAFLGCNATVAGDLAAGVARQSAYWCSTKDYSGREQVWAIDFPAATDARILLTALSGDPDVIVLRGCDPAACVGTPGDGATLTGAVGTHYVIVDCAPGDEGTYELRVDCRPLPSSVDCAGATFLACGDSVTGDLAAGQPYQDLYWCTTIRLDGSEQVYALDLSTPARLAMTLVEESGDPDLVFLSACSTDDCRILDYGTSVVDVAAGTYYLVVDCVAGQEGAYQLQVDCLVDTMEFCGTGLLETNRYGAGNGNWYVAGWLYPGDTSNYALRVDGTTTFAHDNSCATDFTSRAFGVIGATGQAFVQWDSPMGSIREEFVETSSGGCCGLLVAITVTNTDVTPHSYEFRTYHDTAFGNRNNQGCPGTGISDGGPITIAGNRYTVEQELLSLGADGCEGQVQAASGDEPDVLRASYEMLPPNTPTIMEWIRWNQGGNPCTAAGWSGFVDGDDLSGCTDNSLLFVWEFPQGGGTLAPGESARAAYRIGMRCAWPCVVACESPTMTTATAEDIGPCNDGIGLTWAPASFPGSGSGVYHVYRSETSAADALTRPPISRGGIIGTTWTDGTTLPGRSYYYVIQAEALDFPNCGIGPLVNGSTDEIEPVPQPLRDDADVVGPASSFGDALRATGHRTDTVDFAWPDAPAPGPDESYVVLRSDDDPEGPFVLRDTTVARTWTDPAAPPRYDPVHVWYYDMRIADACGNLSLD